LKAKTKFMKVFADVPNKAKNNLVSFPYSKNPMTINVMIAEVEHNTKLGKKILKDLGFEDD